MGNGIFLYNVLMFVSISLAFILHQSPGRHSHSSLSVSGHSHSLTEEHRNTSVRAAFIHVLGDLLQSLGVLLAATIIYFRVSNITITGIYKSSQTFTFMDI